MTKEAEMMCSLMLINNKPVDFYVDPSPNIWDSRNVRCDTLNFMVNILEKTSAAEHKTVKEEPASRRGPGGDGDDIAADGAANTTGYGWSTCF